MGKETRVGVGVVGALLALSIAVLYGRLTRDPGPQIDVNIGVEQPEDSGANGNDVPRAPTIEQEPPAYGVKPVSPVQQPPRPVEEPGRKSFLPDSRSDGVRQIAIPDPEPAAPYLSPVQSPATTQRSPALDDSVRAARREPGS